MTDEQVWVTVYAAVLQGLIAKGSEFINVSSNRRVAAEEADMAVMMARRKRESDWA
jgi:hypothetical protein